MIKTAKAVLVGVGSPFLNPRLKSWVAMSLYTMQATHGFIRGLKNGK